MKIIKTGKKFKDKEEISDYNNINPWQHLNFSEISSLPDLAPTKKTLEETYRDMKEFDAKIDAVEFELLELRRSRNKTENA